MNSTKGENFRIKKKDNQPTKKKNPNKQKHKNKKIFNYTKYCIYMPDK